MTTNWYLVQTKPNAHRIATRNLVRQGCQVFMPMVKLTRRVGNRFINNLSPLFPGYLFVGLGTDKRPSWRSLNSTLGVSRVISHDGQYRPLPLSLIDEFQTVVMLTVYSNQRTKSLRETRFKFKKVRSLNLLQQLTALNQMPVFGSSSNS